MKTCSKTADRHDGFTIIEVMIGILILVILAVAVPTALKHPRVLVISAAHKQAAIHAANEVLETLSSMDYAQVPTGDSSLDFGARYHLNGRTLPLGKQSVVEFNNPDFKQITITVDHPGGEGFPLKCPLP